MFSFEGRWAQAVLASFAPSEGPGLAPKIGEVDYLNAYETLRTRSTWLAGIGVRAALWLVVLSPWWLGRSLFFLPSLSQGARIDVLGRMLEHRVFLVREAAFLMKLAACLALLGSDAVRARSGYDGQGTAPVLPARRLDVMGGP